MNILTFADNGNMYVDFRCVESFAFKYAALRAKSALLQVICAVFGLVWANYAHFNRARRLSLRISSA